MGSRTALVTGASQRIGRAIALDLAKAGWAVAVHYNSSADAAQETTQEIGKFGVKAVALQADLSDFEQVSSLVPRCAEEIGAPALLVNNASLFEQDDIESLNAESFHEHMRVNFRAPLFLSQSFAASLPSDMAGNIINILDQRVWKLTPDFVSYTLSKSALWTATRTLAQALAPSIRVNAIGPGPTLANDRQSEEGFRKQQEATILQRGPELEELCRAVRFIIDAPSMTGQMIALDGGQHLAWRTPDVYDYGPKE